MAGSRHDRHAQGFDGLAGLAQTALTHDLFSGHLFVFRGKRGDIVKLALYNATRVRSTLGYVSPMQERNWLAAQEQKSA